MNSITSKAFQNIAFLFGISLLALVAVLFVPAHLAHAQDDDGGDYSGGCDCDTGGYTSYPDTSYTSYPDTSYTSYPDTSYTSYPDTTDYSTGYDTGYDTGYNTGYSTGGYTLPYSTGYSTGYSLPYTTSAPSNTNVNTNTNTCTTDSCNTTNNNNISNPAPIIYNPVITTGGSSCDSCSCSGGCYQPTTCYTCGCPGYQSCYTPVVVPSTPVAYNYPPSISLSAVPYTGLDLTPTEQVLYWSFLVLWCLAAAYLIAVKRVQMSLVRWLNASLFGTGASTSVKASVASKPARSASVSKVETKAETADSIDPFILSQVNR